MSSLYASIHADNLQEVRIDFNDGMCSIAISTVPYSKKQVQKAYPFRYSQRVEMENMTLSNRIEFVQYSSLQVLTTIRM